MAESDHRHNTEPPESHPAPEANLSNFSLGGEAFVTQMDPAAPVLPTTTAPAPAPPPTQALSVGLGRYAIVQLHAQGGLGKVSIARDEVLGRTVALKEMRDDRAINPELLRRFIDEAAITGQLEHPAIVPVYSLDYDAQGKPYYAMRFIEGPSLRTAITAYHEPAPSAPSPGKVSPGEVTLRKLLTHFIAVCHAVGYAHSKGILHRDLKPENILLGDYGETLVVDWGLAKIMKHVESDPGNVPPDPERLRTSTLGMQHSETHAGQIMGTPAYMSPEQARGETVRQGPATDIYALGAILYNILTGKPPYEGGSWEVIRKLQNNSLPPAPRTMNPKVPRGLEAVCGKAMSLQPAQRYATAQELAVEVEHWLADEPVTAYAEPWTLRTRRWLRRHRTLVASSFVALVVAVGALLVGLVAVSLEQAETERARQTALANEQRALQEKTRTEAAHRLAQQHQLEAEAKYRLAREATDELLSTLHDKLTTSQNIHQVRREMLLKAREMYRKFLREKGPDPEIQVQLVRIQGRLAALLDQTVAPREAEQVYQETLRLSQELAERYPDQAAYVHLLAQERHNYGLWLAAQERHAAAREHYEAAIALHRQLAVAFPLEMEYWSDLSNHYNNLGLVLEAQHQIDAADAMLRESERLRRGLLLDAPRSANVRYLLAGVVANRGRLYYLSGRLPEAEPLMRESIALQRVLVAQHPDYDRYRYSLGQSYNNLANLLRDQGRLAEAETEYHAGIALQEAMVRDFPAVLHYRVEVARTQANLAQLFQNQGRYADAETLFRRAMTQRDYLLQREPGNPQFQERLAYMAFQVGLMLNQQGRSREALAPLQQALDLYLPLVRAQPEQIFHRFYLGRCQRQLCFALQAQQDLAAAEPLLRQALEHFAAVVRHFPTRHDVRLEHAECLDALGLLLQERQRDQDALPFLRAALTERRQLHAEMPRDVLLTKDLAGTCCNLGHSFLVLGQLEEANQCYHEGIQLLLPLPRQGVTRRYLANCYWGRARVHVWQGRGVAALVDQQASMMLSQPPP